MADQDNGAKLDKRTKAFLEKFSRKNYTQDDVNKAEQKADLEYKDKLGETWDKVRLLFQIAKHPTLWGPQFAVMATIAVIYLVSPVDAIPDFIPVGGLVDDVGVVGFMIAALMKSFTSFSKEKKMNLRSSIPADLRTMYDSIMGLSPEDISRS